EGCVGRVVVVNKEGESVFCGRIPALGLGAFPPPCPPLCRQKLLLPPARAPSRARPSEVGAPAITVQRSDPEGAPRSDTSWATATSCTRCGVPSCAPTASMGSGRIDPLFRGVVAGHALLNGD